MVPKLPATFRELTAAEYQASKVQASTMEQTKQRNVVAFLNQTLMSFHNKQVREKFSLFMTRNNIAIVSDIFERMDLNRRINESLRVLQA